MTRIWLPLLAVATLAACAPKAPPTAQGVGFGSYEQYAYSAERARQAQLETPLELRPENTGAPSPAAHGDLTISAQDLAAAGIDTSASVRVRRADGTVVYGPGEDVAPGRVDSVPASVSPIPPQAAVSTSNPNPSPTLTATGTTGPAPLSALKPGSISDEQNFDAVSARESIASDAARRAEQQSQYSQVTQTVAQRPAETGADIVAYALSTSHGVGTKQFSRSFASEAKARRACARYSGSDQAQRAFLEAGGPQRDRLGVDPDGDGFACGWNPGPFRAARAG